MGGLGLISNNQVFFGYTRGIQVQDFSSLNNFGRQVSSGGGFEIWSFLSNLNASVLEYVKI